MFSKKLAALVATSMIVATAPAAAQSSQALSVTGTRAAAELNAPNELGGGSGGFWAAAIGIALVAALVLVVTQDDEVDLPTSP